MKKLSKIILILVLVLGLTTGCKKQEENNTVAKVLKEQFLKEMKSSTSIEEEIEKISQNEEIKVAVGTNKIEETTYYDGFDGELSGIKNAYTIKPMIGTIPFVAYIFEVDNTEEFQKQVNEKVNKRWNICTEADDMEMAVVNNYVFVVLSPSTFE